MAKKREKKQQRKVRRYLKSQRNPVTLANICSGLFPLKPAQVRRALDAMTGEGEVVVYGALDCMGEEVIGYGLKDSQADWLPMFGYSWP